MSLIVCPGIHSAELTNQFLAGFGQTFCEALVFPAHLPTYSALHILEFVQESEEKRLNEPQKAAPLFFIAFSAGVVGAIGAARLWHRAGGQVGAVIAIDGWGVPLYGGFPIHRISHDFFTHWTSAGLGAGQDSFYADPAVGHLDVWQSPQTVSGQWVRPLQGDRISTTASKFILALLHSSTSVLHLGTQEKP